MNKKRVVQLSNVIGIVAILCLLYWTFIFISITVFGLKVFKENITETFYMSVFGILTLMAGALIINIMLNLTRIAEKLNADTEQSVRRWSGKLKYLFILSFLIIFGLLYLGDVMSSKKKEKYLISATLQMTVDFGDKLDSIANYRWDNDYLKATAKNLSLMSAGNEQLNYITVIQKDTVDGHEVFLNIHSWYSDTYSEKRDFIYRCSLEEKEYLKKVFNDNYKESRFSAHDGDYELYYPISRKNKTIVLYITDQQRYGKIGR